MLPDEAVTAPVPWPVLTTVKKAVVFTSKLALQVLLAAVKVTLVAVLFPVQVGPQLVKVEVTSGRAYKVTMLPEA
jgi:hypothetical protein